MAKIRTIIVDDEVHARKKMRALLETHDDVVIVGECDNGPGAVSMIRETGADVAFIDIQMPGMSGLDVVRSLPADQVPMVVFATAYDRFAVEAFEAHAVDYLLKPIDPERLRKTLDHVRGRLAAQSAGQSARRLDRLIRALDTARGRVHRFAVKSGGAIHVVDVDDIDWIEADGNYVTFHASGKTYLHRESLRNVEDKLDPERFVRIHRSRIVRIDRVRQLKPDRHGDYTVVLKDSTELALSRTHRDDVLARLGGESDR